MTLGEKVRILREKLDMSQEELAEKMNYKSKTSIHKIETNITDLPLSKVKELAEVLKTTPAYLMDWEEDVNLKNKVENNIISDEEKATFIKDIVEKIEKGYSVEEVSKILSFPNIGKFLSETIVKKDDLFILAKSNKDVFNALADTFVALNKKAFKKAGVPFDSEDEDTIKKNLVDYIDKRVATAKPGISNYEKDIFSQLTTEELAKLEKFKNMSTVMFMNEGNEISDNDKRTLAVAYAEVLISQRKK